MLTPEEEEELRVLSDIILNGISPALRAKITAHSLASIEMGIDPDTSAEFFLNDLLKRGKDEKKD